MFGSYKCIFSIQQQTKEMNPISQCPIAIFNAVVDEQCSSNTTLHVFGLPFNISIDIIKNEIMACTAQSLGQQVETRSHDSSARLKIKCIMIREA